MSSNVTFMPNTTSQGNSSRVYFNFKPFIDVLCGLEVVLSVVGTVLNLWFLVAILRSVQLRSHLRNKIICNSFVLHLVDSAVVLPMAVWGTWNHTNEPNFVCIYFSVLANTEFIQDFIANWLLVMIIAVFIAQIEDLKLGNKVTPRVAKFGTWGLLIFPWIASVIVIPAVSSPQRSCLYSPTFGTRRILRSVDTVVPIVLSVVMVAVASCLRYRRFSRGRSSSSMQVELISAGPEIDKSYVYIIAVVVSIGCDLLRLIFTLVSEAFMEYGIMTRVKIIVVAIILNYGRVVFMVLPWLLLPDVRQRIKTWRPWHQPEPGVDLKMTYRSGPV